MPVVLLLNNRSLHFYDFKELKERYGIEVIPIVTDKYYQTLPHHIKEHVKKFYIQEGQQIAHTPLQALSLEKIEEILLEELKHHPHLQIIASDELNGTIAAFLRTKYALGGTPSNIIVNYRDKFQQKTLLKKNGVKVPNFLPFVYNEQLGCSYKNYQNIIEKIGQSFIIKPVGMAYTVGVRIIHSAEDLSQYFDKFASFKRFIIEEYISAKLYHCDLIVQNGEYFFAEVSEYLWNGLSFINGRIHGSLLLSKDNPFRQKIIDFCKNANSILGMINGCTHMEIFVTSNGDIYFLEAGARPAGSLVPLILSKTFNTNYMNMALLAELNSEKIPFKDPETYYFWAYFPKTKGVVQSIQNPPLKSKYKIQWDIKKGDKFNDAISIIDKSGYLIAHNKHYQELLEDFHLLRDFQAVKFV